MSFTPIQNRGHKAKSALTDRLPFKRRRFAQIEALSASLELRLNQESARNRHGRGGDGAQWLWRRRRRQDGGGAAAAAGAGPGAGAGRAPQVGGAAVPDGGRRQSGRGSLGDGDRLAHRRPPCRARHLRSPPRFPRPPRRVRARDPRPGPQCQVRVSEPASVLGRMFSLKLDC
jgi:hypothetical protein